MRLFRGDIREYGDDAISAMRHESIGHVVVSGEYKEALSCPPDNVHHLTEVTTCFFDAYHIGVVITNAQQRISF
ncbi:MAG: hypothetical protein UY90_C0022G0007 [Candidatus Peregrinibacteria bacterium GW2011_GWA2_54_9]|nr:MAG: hypothetical protein UY90_C0022G0007 [Candidatus Peregrinibacteria bacterium GW2011_GWA2_54_9]